MKTRQQKMIEMIMSREQPTSTCSVDRGSQAIINVPMKLRHEARRKQLNATCIYCNGDVLDILENSARDSDYYKPQSPSTTFKCPHCGRALEFELGRETVLYWARPIVKEPS